MELTIKFYFVEFAIQINNVRISNIWLFVCTEFGGDDPRHFKILVVYYYALCSLLATASALQLQYCVARFTTSIIKLVDMYTMFMVLQF